MDLHIKNSLNNDFILKTDFLILQAQVLSDHKDLITGHYTLYNWLQFLDKNHPSEENFYSIFKTKMMLLKLCNRMRADNSVELLYDILKIVRYNNFKYVRCDDQTHNPLEY